jgi:formylglycine-generating enzyme required for sulfatase activity
MMGARRVITGWIRRTGPAPAALFLIGMASAGLLNGAETPIPKTELPRVPRLGPGEETVLVPSGEFLMGSPSVRTIPVGEKPQHSVTLKAFRIDRYEITNNKYSVFLRAIATVHPHTCAPGETPGKDHTPGATWWKDPLWNAPNKPVVGVDWFDAYAYCAWTGGHLPTEAQWEKAARGVDGRVYPWGSEFIPGVLLGNFADEAAKSVHDDWKVLGNYDDKFVTTAPVGSFPEGRSPYGVEDMAGNVWEWVADYFANTTYGEPNSVDPKGPATGDVRVLRGGSWDSHPSLLRTATRHRHYPTYRSFANGFRCARDVP